jgi:hypothetical protein
MKISRFDIHPLVTLVAVGLIAVTASMAEATTLGWGDRTVGNNDSDADMIIVSTGASTQTLTAGTYQATNFNFQFTEAQTTIGGSVRPLILISPSTNVYNVIAMGSVIPYSAPTSFGTVAFGGTNTFTLAATTQVFGGFYWDGSSGQRNPIGFNGGGDAFLRCAGAAAPALNTNISGGFPLGFTGRAYDFSIDISPVPEPCTVVLGGTAALGFAAIARRRRRQHTVKGQLPRFDVNDSQAF